MNVIDQLQQMTNENYNPTKLKNELEALFKEPENFKIYQEAIKSIKTPLNTTVTSTPNRVQV